MSTLKYLKRVQFERTWGNGKFKKNFDVHAGHLHSNFKNNEFVGSAKVLKINACALFKNLRVATTNSIRILLKVLSEGVGRCYSSDIAIFYDSNLLPTNL